MSGGQCSTLFPSTMNLFELGVAEFTAFKRKQKRWFCASLWEWWHLLWEDAGMAHLYVFTIYACMHTVVVIVHTKIIIPAVIKDDYLISKLIWNFKFSESY